MRQLAPVRDSDRLDVATNQIRATTPRPPPPRQLRPPATALPLSVGRPFAFAWNESSDTAVLPFASQINCVPPAKANNCSFKMEVIFCVRGALSPLLANLLLDDLDKELERRGHRFCRYADDCNIYVQSQAAGERVMASIVAFLEGKLRLKVNRKKSAVAPTKERSFLGHRLLPGGRLGMAPKSLNRAKDKLRQITRRNRGVSLERMIADVNSFVTGWVTYFRHAACKDALGDLDEWLRRKLRCVRLKQCKRTGSIAAFLMKCGVSERNAWLLALSGKGWWRLSGSQPAHAAMTLRWFAGQELVSLQAHHAALQPAGNRRVR